MSVIDFSIHQDLIDIKEIKPKPAKHFLPDWYKKIPKYSWPGENIRGCMPFLDGISAGYILPLPQDIKITFNFLNEKTDTKDVFIGYSSSVMYKRDAKEYCKELNINYGEAAVHGLQQLGGESSFPIKKNGGFNVLKILNPWKIKTPAGYSCLFISPILNENDYFHIISAIVDTDTYEDKINFPFIINADKYEKFEKTFPVGLPYVQVIPFKREDWQHRTQKEKVNHNFLNRLVIQFMNRYKKIAWSRKKWM